MSLTVYARGFLGSAENSAKVERTAIKKPFPTIFDSVGKSTVVTVNPEIMRSYEQLVRKDVNPESWDWREGVIRTACQAFGTAEIYKWFYANITSPTVSQTHVDFLCDMANFVLGWRERRLPPKSWEDLIAPQARTGPIVLTGYLADIFGSNEGTLDVRDIKIPNQDMPIYMFIRYWMSKRDGTGFSDMVVTLNTLFGDFTFH